MATQLQSNFSPSQEIITVSNALICPPRGKLTLHPVCGVLSEDGDVSLAAMVRPRARLTQPIEVRPESVDRIRGRHLWGGQVNPHFGHFICETIARLWAFKGSGAESVLFIGHSERHRNFAPYQIDLFRTLGIDVPVTIVTDPTEVEELVVPAQGFGLAELGRANDKFLDMMRHMAGSIEPAGPEKIYISRTQTGTRPRVFGEVLIERNLEAHGYTVIHPQNMTIAEQLSQYRAATHIVGLDGSAFHLFGFVARPEAKAAIILRRNTRAYFTMENHLTRAMGHAPDIINVLVADWVLPQVGKPNQLSWGEIDHVRLAAELETRGYINTAAVWEGPAVNDLNAELTNLKESGTELVRCAVQVPITEKS